MNLSSPVRRARVLERFLQYVQIDTAADPSSLDYPSSPGQRALGEILVQQLRQTGVSNAHQDEHGLVWGKIEANGAHDAPAILFNAHLDTSPEASGTGVQPRVIENYPGGAIDLQHHGQRITPELCPELRRLHGKTLVVTDGRTLLGGDDKAGVAAIMELVSVLTENPSIPHGPIQILFTCDEEIGHGTLKLQRDRLHADVGYTLDGGGIGDIDEETFSADMATISFRGHNIHPSIGKGRMVNSLRAAGYFIAMLPTDRLSPESTEGRQGFIHPYHLAGSVDSSVLQLILRDFETSVLNDHRDLLIDIADETERRFPGLKIVVETEAQYRNMRDGLRRLPMSVELPCQAYRKMGIEPRRNYIRGGTDGAMLTALGLPTPNLSVGQYNIHSVLEFACLDEILLAAAHLVELVQLWSSVKRAELP